jgi:ech hydrogenase subunit C
MLDRLIKLARAKSPWVVHFDCGSCNGCDIETLACLTPVYDIERFGGINVGNPKHADVLLVTGTVNHRNKHALRALWEQIPNPKIVVAIGACGLTGGIFRDAYNVVGGADKVIPVDVFVPGCPAKPEAIIDGLVMALGKLANGDTASARAAANAAAPPRESAGPAPEGSS